MENNDELKEGQEGGAPLENIGERLSERESGSEKKEGGEVREADSLPFDLSKLDREQLQTLKSMLAATPEGQTRKKANPRVRLRRIDGQIVVDIKNAYLGLVRDNDLNRDVERHIIPVKFLGSEEFKPILYKKFIESEQVPCEVLSTRQAADEVVEGETISRTTGTMVEMVKKSIKYWFTVKLPEGSGADTIEIEGKMANA